MMEGTPESQHQLRMSSHILPSGRTRTPRIGGSCMGKNSEKFCTEALIFEIDDDGFDGRRINGGGLVTMVK